MSSKGKEAIFLPTLHFVNPDDEESKKIAAHVVQENTRRRKQLQLVKPPIIAAGPLPWRRVSGLRRSPDRPSKKKKQHFSAHSTVKPSARKSAHPTRSTDRQAPQNKSLALYNSPQSILDAGRTDPFGAYPVPSPNARTDVLAHFGTSWQIGREPQTVNQKQKLPMTLFF
jgi:hypothetical protein